MVDLQINVHGSLIFTEDGVIIPVTREDFIRLMWKFPTLYKRTGPESDPTLHLERKGITICIVPVREVNHEQAFVARPLPGLHR